MAHLLHWFTSYINGGFFFFVKCDSLPEAIPTVSKSFQQMRQRASHRHQRPLGFGFLQRQSEVVQCHPCTWAKDWEERKWGPNKCWDCQPEFGWNWYIYIYNIYIYIMYMYVYIYMYGPHILYYINKLHDHLNTHTNELQGGSIAASKKSDIIIKQGVCWNTWIHDSHINIAGWWFIYNGIYIYI